MRTFRSSRRFEITFFWAVAAILLFALTLARNAATPPILLGTAWYPEQWPESRWDVDLKLMQAPESTWCAWASSPGAAWSPRKASYDLDWLDRAITAAAKHGIFVVLGTPTAAPPAWLTQKYPDTLRTEEDGRKAEHGDRAQFNFANPTYREFCAQDRRADGEALRPQPQRPRLADRQRVRARSPGTDDHGSSSSDWLRALRNPR